MVALGGLGPLDFPSKKLRTVPVCRARKLGSWGIPSWQVPNRNANKTVDCFKKKHTQKMITDLQKSICLG